MNTQDPYSWIDPILNEICVIGTTLEGQAEAKQRLISEFERVKKEALLKQARHITVGGRGGTEVFIENTPLESVKAQLSKEQNT